MLSLRRFVFAFALLALLGGQRSDADTAGGTQISNFATATYSDHAGRSYQTQSNTVVSTVAKLAAIVVSPKETQPNPAGDGVGVGQVAIRTFTISNTSNITDAYRITALAAGRLTIASVAFITPGGSIPVTVNSTVSASVSPGASIQVQVNIATSGLAVGQAVPVTITAQTTVTGTTNGLQSDSGEAWLVGATGPTLVGPGGTGSAIQKTVNGTQMVQGQPGQVVTFAVSGENAGGTPATHVVVTDTLVTGYTPVLASAQVNGAAAAGATVSGETITIPVGTVGGNMPFTVSFQANVTSGAQLGASFPNVAAISADGLPSLTSTPVAVLIGTSDIVFDGYEGASHPIAGATIMLLDAQGKPVPIQGSVSTGPANAGTAAKITPSSASPGLPAGNPQQTAANGSYAFALSPSQIAAGGTTFTLEISAAGFLNRKIQVLVDPNSIGLYNVTETSLDGQPLAAAGGFRLVNNNVTLANVFDLFGNVPLFTPASITVTKTSDVDVASIGDRIQYSVQFQNSTTTAFGSTTVVDTLPAFIAFATGTGSVDGVPAQPVVDGRHLTWTIASLAPAASHTIAYDGVVFPGVSPGAQLINSVIVSTLIPGSTARATGSANASVTIAGGAFSSNRAVLGRVFIDTRRTGHFVRGDTGVAGVRVFLEDGSYVTTDPNGFFSFASVRPGQHVIRVDILTLPRGVHPYPGARMNSNRAMQQLAHGVMDDGVLDDIEFALEPVK